MRSAWDGWGVLERNTVATDLYTAWNRRCTLHDTPGVPTEVQLPPNTHAILLWTSTEQIWYAIDEAPDPIGAPVTDSFVEASAFRLGDVLIPAGAGGGWQTTGVPDPALAHSVHLRSESIAPTVHIVALREMGA